MFQVQIFDAEGHLVHHFPLEDKPISFGRDPGCDITLSEVGISREHAVIEPYGKFYQIKDLGSTNGTWVNKKHVQKQILKSGDVIYLGSFRIVIKQVFKHVGTDSEDLAQPGQAKFSASAFEFDGSHESAHTVRLDVQGELRQYLSGKKILERLVNLQELSRELGLIETPDILQKKALDIVLSELKADRAAILIPDRNDHLKPAAALSTIKGETGNTFDIHQDVVETVVQERAAILTEDARTDERFGGDPAAAPDSVHSVMCAPLVTSNKLEGVLYVDRVKRTKAFLEEDLRIFAVLANQVAVSLTNARLFQDVLTEKRKVQAIIQSLNDGLVITDGNYRIQKHNQSAARALSRENIYLVGKNLLEVLNARCDSFDLESFHSSVEKAGSFDFEITTGERFQTFTATVATFGGSESKRPGHIFSFRDMTAFVNLEILKSQFIRLASHKLKTPLTILIGNMELLQEMNCLRTEDSDVVSLVDGMASNLGKIQALVNRFVEFVELDRLREPFQEIDLNDVLVMARAGMDARAQARNVTIKFVADTREDVLVHGIQQRLVQCFTNILDNAVKFSPHGATITVRLASDERNFHVHIEDDGPGIPKSHLPFIFCGFHQVEDIPTGEADGAGLGLTIAKRILYTHGAAIEAKSPVPESDCGTRITVSFPRDLVPAPSTRVLEADLMMALL